MRNRRIVCDNVWGRVDCLDQINPVHCAAGVGYGFRGKTSNEVIGGGTVIAGSNDHNAIAVLGKDQLNELPIVSQRPLSNSLVGERSNNNRRTAYGAHPLISSV
jgi:hypothetical protein